MSCLPSGNSKTSTTLQVSIPKSCQEFHGIVTCFCTCCGMPRKWCQVLKFQLGKCNFSAPVFIISILTCAQKLNIRSPFVNNLKLTTWILTAFSENSAVTTMQHYPLQAIFSISLSFYNKIKEPQHTRFVNER